MAMRNKLALLSSAAAFAVIAAAVPARATVTVVNQTAAAPTYSVTLNFDEAGGPTGNNVANNSWAGAPWNIPVFSSGDVVANDVADHSTLTGQGTNSYYGPNGVFINFSQPMSALSFQGWDSSGPASPFGGGATAIALSNGVEVASWFGTPAFGGIGKTWFDITTTDGSTFDEVRFLGFGFPDDTVVDNLSWNTAPVPEPTSLASLGVVTLGALRRRR